MKRKYVYIGMSVIILIFGLYVIKNFKYRLENDELEQRDEMSGKKGVHDNSKSEQSAEDNDGDNELAYVVLNDEKQKAPDFKMVDQDGDTITREDYKDKVYVVDFFYSTCPTICPIMTDNLVKVQDKFKDNKKFGIASFSIDPEHDNPDVLRDYADDKGVTSSNWHLMTGDKDEIYKMAREDFKLKAMEDPNEPGGILHSGMFALVDKDGYIRSRKDKFGNPILYYRGFIEQGKSAQEGEEPQIDILEEDIKKLLHE